MKGVGASVGAPVMAVEDSEVVPTVGALVGGKVGYRPTYDNGQ